MVTVKLVHKPAGKPLESELLAICSRHQTVASGAHRKNQTAFNHHHFFTVENRRHALTASGLTPQLTDKRPEHSGDERSSERKDDKRKKHPGFNQRPYRDGGRNRGHRTGECK